MNKYEFLYKLNKNLDNFKTTERDEITHYYDELIQDAVVRNLEIIGEAANNIQRVDPAFTATHAEIPWAVMYAMRNRLTHGYDTVDLDVVWVVVERDLRLLKPQIAALLH